MTASAIHSGRPNAISMCGLPLLQTYNHVHVPSASPHIPWRPQPSQAVPHRPARRRPCRCSVGRWPWDLRLNERRGAAAGVRAEGGDRQDSGRTLAALALACHMLHEGVALADDSAL